MEKLNSSFHNIVTYVVENKATMPDEVKKSIAAKCHNVIERLGLKGVEIDVKETNLSEEPKANGEPVETSSPEPSQATEVTDRWDKNEPSKCDDCPDAPCTFLFPCPRGVEKEEVQ